MLGQLKTINMSKNTDFDANSITTISTGTLVKGDIVSEGDFRIVGKLIGSINSKGKVVIGQSGSIEGDIICQNADIAGDIKGNVKVDNLLLLKSTSKLIGNISTAKLSIEAGAEFSGNCSMQNSSAKIGHESEKTK
jgi:cytoskeletal protein CcmA (bactofilin family)